MSGDSQRNDDPDFLDDFIVEDLAGKNDDLEQLFDAPGSPKPAPSTAPAVADSEDVLFTDHTVGFDPSERFQGGAAFAEDAPSSWQGEGLELDAEAPTSGGVADKLAAAEAAFAEELGSLASSDEDLALDGEDELELVDGPSAIDGISELEQSGPFVLDDSEGAWQEQQPTRAAPAPLVEPEVAEGIWEAVEEPAMAEHAVDEAAIEEPGWEPLPEASVDELAEVGEVAPAEELPPDAEELAEHEGHDIYSQEQTPVLVGPGAGSRRRFGLVAALAASLALVGGAAVVVMRPEWVGLQLEPQRVQQVQIERPRVEVAVAAPPALKAPASQLGQTQPPKSGQPTTEPAPVPTPTKDPVATGPTTTPDPVATVPQPSSTQPQPPTTPPTPTPNDPSAQVATVPPVVPSVSNWPIVPEATPQPGPRGKGKGTPLVRLNDNTMLGDSAPSAPRARAVEGMLPGTRAFAQLHNGNYFIGSIKTAEDDRVTLRINEGEVTIPSADIARLTALGSADYEALQKATSGFVRLTNSNRLVGGILSQIADDHIVLEFRSNRVILPKSAVGQVVQGEAELEVRLDVTREEDDWVRNLAERQLGKATDVPKRAPAVPGPTPGAMPTPPADSRQH